MQWNGASHCEFDFQSMESETTTWSEFCNGRKTIVEQIIASKERDKSKEVGRGSYSMGTIWVRWFEIEKLK